jgi:uncharacterized protein with FMN-binding domain
MSPKGPVKTACVLLLVSAAWRAFPADGLPADTLSGGRPGAEAGAAAPDSGSAAAWRDGSYDGQSPGWTGMSVQVSVDSGRIRSVKVLNARGSARFYDRVLLALPERIVRANGTDVDAVTGATLSSRSLIEAVRTALSGARAPAGG